LDAHSTAGEALRRLTAREHLSREQARRLLQEIFAGHASEAAIAGVLVALAMKGETVDEIVGFAEAMRAAVVDIGLDQGKGAGAGAYVDTCGTGGSARNCFNISTAAAFVAAGAGAAVAKHGNRTNTSVSGSADVLEACGVNLALPAERLGPCLRAIGVVFLYAPLLHGAMHRVIPARRALGIRTIFNLLGPLTNPAGARAQVVGVPSAGLIPVMAEALLRLGTRHSFVVRSEDGLGEFSTTATTWVAEIQHGEIREYRLDARKLGLPRAQIADLTCSSREDAAAALAAVLEGEAGARRDITCLNAAAALVAAGRASDMDQGLELARAAIDSGAAREKLAALVRYTNEQSGADVPARETAGNATGR
jgi:anthranilate phosphoribosyltransferase